MQKRMNRKGQDLSIGTLILIVLGIVVLVLLILGFSLGWDDLWEKINIFGGGSSIGDVASACAIKATSNDVYGYCNEFVKVKVGNSAREFVNCEDDRVKQGISNQLSCGGNFQERFNAQCASMSTSDREKVLVNGQQCPTTNRCAPLLSECESLAATQEACVSPCVPIPGTGSPPSSDRCGLSNNANAICARYNSDQDACNEIDGCAYS